MNEKVQIALPLLAAAAVALSLFNASWIAGPPNGRLIVVANRGITHPQPPGASGPCAGARILPPGLNFIENTVPALRVARMLRADAVAIDVRRTRDGRMVAFRDETLDCRTDGRGRVADRTLDELKGLDMGYRYTPDGTSFPLRGRGVGLMSSVSDILWEMGRTPVLFTFRGGDAADADALAAEFARARVPIDGKYGFIGEGPAVERMSRLAPRAWTYSRGSSERCLASYRRTGWLGNVPESCRGATVALVPGPNWTVWGWPYRFLTRLIGAGGRAMLVERIEADGTLRGLGRPEQVPEVPGGFRGYLWIEDMARAGYGLQR